MRTIFLALIAAAFAATASAQTGTTPNPILTHYRAYQAALERNDLAAAEVAAEAALQASEARDGDGGRTAILALNLAQLRLDRGRAREALAPAQRAHALALSRGAQSQVDPLVANLLVGQAELGGEDGDEARVIAALEEAKERTDIHAEAYGAALALSAWAFAKEKWEAALSASIAMGRHAEGSHFETQLARAIARRSEGAALVMTLRRDREAHAALTDALELCRPLSAVQAADGGVTVAQAHCAHALAWLSVLVARMQSEGGPAIVTGSRLRRESDYDLVFGRETRSDAPKPCAPRLISEPRPSYPAAALNRLGVGAVVLRLKVDAAGDLVDRRIVASVPDEGGFREAVERVMNRWRVERREDSPPDCSMEMTAYIPVRFVIR